jgi:hypothetical protein
MFMFRRERIDLRTGERPGMSSPSLPSPGVAQSLVLDVRREVGPRLVNPDVR